MPFRRNRPNPTVTLDLTGIDMGPPPERSWTGDRRRRTSDTTPPVSRAGVNGLAGLCMLTLVITGLGFPLPGGHLAADAILVVVGFQLGLGVIRLAGTAPNWLRRYWLSAIGPVAVPALVAVTLVATYWWLLGLLGPAETRGAVASLFMVTNLTPLLGDASFAGTEHLWLISLVVQFAVAAPLAAIVTRRTKGPRTMAHLIIALIAVVVVVRLTIALTGLLSPSTLAQLPLTRADGLLLGLGLAVAPRSWIERIPIRAVPVALAAMAAIFVLAPDPGQRPAISLGILLPVVVAASAVIVATRTPDGTDAVSRFLGSLGPRWLGERAISIYVWHQLFGMAVEDMAEGGLFGADWPGVTLFVTRLVFALAAGAASYRYIQLPLRTGVDRVLSRRRQVASRAKVTPPPALSAG